MLRTNPELFTPDTTYEIGQPVPPDLCPRHPRHMIHVVAYDIADPKRLRQVAKTCEDYGVRVEYSVFECDLPEQEFTRLWLKLLGIINEDEDFLVAYRLCAACADRVEGAGRLVRPTKRIAYVFGS